MSIRIVVRVSDAAHVVNGGALGASVSYRTFDVELPEVERILRREETYVAYDFVGVELIPAKPDR
jgi:hypothetical protein